MTEGDIVLGVEGLITEIRSAAGQIRPTDGVSLFVREGESVAIVGESGSGKTLTARALMGLMPESGRVVGGTVSFKGKILAAEAGSFRRTPGMAMVFQDPMTFLNPLMRIGDQVAEAVRINEGASRRRAASEAVDMLHLVGMPNPESISQMYPHQLSGGMRQRALIAIALACRPSLLIADEPTTALDVTIQAQIMALLARLRQTFGNALLLITHDLGLVAQYCDRVYVMYAGRIVEAAGVEALFASPRHPYTRGLLGSVLRIDRRQRRFAAIEGGPPRLAALPSGCRFQPRCGLWRKLGQPAVCGEIQPPLVALTDRTHGVACHFATTMAPSVVMDGAA